MFAEHVDKLTGGQIKIEAVAAGQYVPPFEILDATNKKVIDGGHGVAWPIGGASPQAFGWFKRPIKSLADLKGMKCRETGIVGDIYQRMGMQTVNMPGGEIVPSAQRGVIDCAEWVGGVEDLRLGLPQAWKHHYTPGMHESNSMLELIRALGRALAEAERRRD